METLGARRVSVLTTATKLVGKNDASGRTVVIRNLDTEPTVAIYIGGSPGVTTSTGFPLYAKETIPIATGAEVYAIASGSSVSAAVMEVYP